MAFTSEEDLVRRIDSAFPRVPWPVDQRACDCLCGECDDLDLAILGRSWDEFSPTEIRYLSDGTSLYSEKAFAHMLPAYMKAALVDGEEADVAVEYLAWKYLPYRSGDLPIRHLNGLDSVQREILCDWLEWFTELERKESEIWHVEEPDADRARRKWLTRMAREASDRVARFEKAVSDLRRDQP
jgi:hypothetical protein